MDEALRQQVIDRAIQLGARDVLTSDDMDAAADELLTITTDKDTLSSAHGFLVGRHASQGGPYLLQAWMIVERALKRRIP
ncbi:MAG: hypothetical protein ABR505_08525 [Actinomycetota bacterium]